MNWLEIESKWRDMACRAQGTNVSSSRKTDQANITASVLKHGTDNAVDVATRITETEQPTLSSL